MTDHEKSGLSRFNRSSAAGGADVKSGQMISDDIVSEGLASLTVLCEQFECDVQAGQTGTSVENVQRVHDDLARIRNLLVVLDKPSIAYVVEELMAVYDPVRNIAITASKASAATLVNAAPQIGDTIRLLQRNRDFDYALTLIPVINDCRACLDKPYISDTFLLATGIDLTVALGAAYKNNRWLKERQIWVELASSRRARLSQCLNSWISEENSDTAQALIKAIENLADSVRQHEYLQVLDHLFMSAAQTLAAISDGQIVSGPALELMFYQLERHVSDYEQVSTPADLVPRDLLRNFLFYAAQSNSESEAALQLRRRFRLDRVRHLASLAEPLTTPTIGVAYHLFSAIRSRITVQTRSLSEWLDNFQHKEQQMPPLATTRVRLNQLGPILKLMGATEALRHLETLNVYLLSRTLSQDINRAMASRLAQLLLDLDTSLDKKARQSIAVGKQSEDKAIGTDAIYIDMAVDVCLREACSDLNTIAACLFSQIHGDEFDTTDAVEINERLAVLGKALQILPLPGLDEILHRLSVSLLKFATASGSSQNAITEQSGESARVTSSISLLVSVFSSISDFLSSVSLPQVDDCEFLVAAQRHTEQLQFVLGIDDDNDQTVKLATPADGMEEQVQSPPELPSVGSGSNESAALEASSLTLSFDEDLLQLPEAFDTDVKPGLSQELLFFSDSAELLDSLAKAVADALTPSAKQRMQMPSLVMLKVLHSLTELAQSVGASQVLATAQPLQRAALALHREGHQFDASQTRFIGELVNAMRVRVQVFDSDRPVDANTTRVENELPEFVEAIRKKTQTIKEKPPALLALRTEELTLEEVFAREAVEILERVNELLADKVFSQEVLNEILASVHTLKGSARMAGKTAIHESAHLLESSVQESRTLADKKETLTQGCLHLQSFLLQAPSQAPLQTPLQMNSAQSNTGQSNTAQSNTGQSNSTQPDPSHPGSTQARPSQSNSSQLDSSQINRSQLDPSQQGPSQRSSESGIDRLISDMYQGTEPAPLEKKQPDESLELARKLGMAQVDLASELSKLDALGSDVNYATLRMREALSGNVVISTASLLPILADLQVSNTELRTLLERSKSAHRQGMQATGRMQQSVLSDSFMSLDQMHGRLTAIVEDAADALGVVARVVIVRNDLLISETVFRKLSPILEHLLRNAVVHGIEKPEERLSVRKPESGTIALSVDLDKADLVLKISDDGRGVSVKAINQLLHKRGETPVNDVGEMHELLFKPGFTSLAHANSIAGHGLGLVAVKNLVRQLDGEITFDTVATSGLTATIRIPRVTIASRVVLVQHNGHLYGLPAADVVSVSQQKDDADSRDISVGAGTLATPVRNVPMNDLLGNQEQQHVHDQYHGPASSPSTMFSTSFPVPVLNSAVDPKPTLIVDTEGQMITTVVDRVIGYRVLIVEPVEESMAESGRFSAVGRLETGQPVLIINFARALGDLDSSGQPQTESSKTGPDIRAAALVMLIDDSPVNRRQLEKLMLARGLAVQLAGNALHALECIEKQKPDLIIMDFDIPAFSARSLQRVLHQKYGENAPPFIAISRHPDVAARSKATGFKCAASISKPCTDTQLYKALELAGMSVADLNIG